MDATSYLPSPDATSLADCLGSWRARYPDMGVLALVPEGDKAVVGVLQDTCRKHSVPLVGAIFPELIEGGVFRSSGVWLLRFDVMPYAGVFADLPQDKDALDVAVGAIATEAKHRLSAATDDATLMLIFDAMVPSVASILDALYLRLANRVRYMGANAGSETFQPMPCLFDNERVVGNGVLVILLQPHRGAVLEHGYRVPEHTLMATSTEGNRIAQIDWRPAFDVYREMALAQYGVTVDQDNFYQYAVHFPFGIVRANGITLVRIPVALHEDGSLFCVGEVPPNSVLALLQAPEVDSRSTLDTICGGLRASEGPLTGRNLLLFYCAGRRLHLGIDAAVGEIGSLSAASGCRRLLGALSLGEIGSSVQQEYPLFHNATLVASLWD